MSKQLFIIDAADASDLTVYKAGESHSLATMAAGDAEIAFSANSKTSVDVDSGECTRVATLAYNAGTQQTWTVDASAMTGEGCIKVIVTTPGTANLPAYNICSTTAGGFVVTKDEFAITESSGTVTITAGVNQHVRIATSGSLEGETATAGDAYVPTTGTAADVAELEEACFAYDGVTNKVGFPVVKPASGVTAGATYNIVVADFVTVSSSKSGMDALKGEKIKMIFACKITGADSGADEITAAIAKLK
jgi:hypothetical protein